MALVDLLERRRRERGLEPFLHADGETWSADALAARADAAAGALEAAGVRPGERVG
jgi:acyl-CoA synthetase (AMP-forming)/AMP-acid ligase II